MNKLKRPRKLYKSLPLVLALCLILGLIFAVSKPVQAANYWETWEELGNTANRTLNGGEYKVTNDTVINATIAGQNGLIINGRVTIYITEGVTLTVSGANGSGQTAGRAGILLPSGSTLILRGEGNLIANGGRAGNGANGQTGDNPYSNGNNTYRGALTLRGDGGVGGGGAGAGIGGNGGTGGTAGTGGNHAVNGSQVTNILSSAGRFGADGLIGSNGGAGAGTLYILDKITINVRGGDAGTRGSGGSGGTHQLNLQTTNGFTTVAGGGGGGGGGFGASAAAIGGGGAGGGGGGGAGWGSQTNQMSGGVMAVAGGTGGSGGAPLGNAGIGGSDNTNWRVSGINGGTTSGGAAVSAMTGTGMALAGNGGRGGNVGSGGGTGTVRRVSTATLTTTAGSNPSSGGGVGTASGVTIISAVGTITYEANAGDVQNMPTNHSKFNGITEYISNVVPMRSGDTFLGWNTHPGGTGMTFSANQIYTDNANLTLFAQWSANHEIIVADKTGAGFKVTEKGINELFDHFDITQDDSVTFTLTVDEIDESTGPAAGVVEILDFAQGRALQFFDITIEKSLNGNRTVLNELPVPIQVVIDLSPELSGRTGYSVYRYHDNEVQLIGMNSIDGEFFMISRETGASGVDQIIINTRRFSTYAIVEHIMALEIDKPESLDVQARIIEEKNLIYRIDIAWGAMKFEFDIDSDEWLESGFDDVNNKITVTNRSNAGVTVEFDANSDIDMDIEAVGTEIVRADTTAGVQSIEAFLLITGEPDNLTPTQFYKQIGTIIVTISAK